MTQTQLEISQICRRFGRRSNHFTDRKVAKGKYKTREGKLGGTWIEGELVHEFLIWLHPSIRLELAKNGIESALRMAEKWEG